ncbi:FAD-linked oxidoreductase OXR2-like protein [Cladobotryum mycophilum]|uniref:FAD-linked oxidoreductase OXR2-like protein n=1 Tax=Cladobotryum mycophilum TaxID=491253 RepID=A0ABR0SW03_9HYPO
MAKISRAPPRALALAAFAISAAAGSSSSTLPILAVPSQAWDSLNSSVSGRLHVGTPANLPCFTSYQNSWGLGDNVPNAEQCKIVEDGLSTSADLIRTFGSYHNPTFGTCMARGQKCTLSSRNPGGVHNDTCYQGTVPDYYVDAREVQDIQRSLEFAQQYKLPVTIKNTGHDYKGRSTGVNTFAIWTHNIAPAPEINENFTPESCPGSIGPVVTYGAGQVGTNLYDSLAGTGYMVNRRWFLSNCWSFGGWVAGGGHGIFSPTFGLGVDNAVQMKVVLPNGTFVTANRCQNQDVFFALRGGGGGTFGVVTETTTALHKDREFTYAFLQMNLPTDPREINEILVANAEKWSDEGWGGLYGVGGIAAGSAARFLGFNANLNIEQAQASLKPVIDYFKSFTSNATLVIDIRTLPNQHAAQNDPVLLGFLSPEAGVSLTRSSRLVPRRNFQGAEAQKQIVDILMTNGWAAVIASPTNHTLPESDKPGGPGEASITPAWRDSLWHLTYRVSWDPADPAATSPEALTNMFATISQQMDPMRAITPDGGAYQNEADVYEPDPIGSFWGAENYARLLSIKRQLDPDNLLSCWNCIGWNKSDERHQCYLNVRGEGP